jgi:5-methylcytosine-specific restriction protein A
MPRGAKCTLARGLRLVQGMAFQHPKGECELCGRQARLTEHHLIPRSQARPGQNAEAIARLCRACHRTIHATFTNHELARSLGTIPRLRAAPRLRRYLQWIQNACK